MKYIISLLFIILFLNSIKAQKNQLRNAVVDKEIVKDTNNILNEVTVTSSKVKEKIFNSSVTIEKLTPTEIKFQPVASFFDGVDNMKGVQMTTAGIGFRIINTRGFNSTTNSRFLQLIDGADNQTPGLQYSIGNIAGVSELDVESVEVVPGVSSAIYGMNALNGTLQTITKSPFKYTGLSVYQRTGINHTDGIDAAPSANTETALRYAYNFKDKFAFKINYSYIYAKDWKADNQTDIVKPGSPYFEVLNSEEYKKEFPFYLGSNKANTYGDELSTPIALQDILGSTNTRTYNVYRTGYAEKSLVNYKVKNWKSDIAFHYKINSKTELYTTYRVGYGDVIFQRGNRFQLKNHGLHQVTIGIKGNNFSWKAYTTIELSEGGNSSNLRVLGENLERRYSNTQASGPWAKDFKSTFDNAIQKGANIENAELQARAYADRNRAAEGSSALQDSVNKTIAINDWTNAGKGARFVTLGKLYHTEGQYLFNQWADLFTLNVGFDARLYQITPDGNNFQDIPGNGKDILMGKVGVFAHIKKSLFKDKLVLEASLRVDKNQYYSPFLNPRISGIYNIAPHHNIRVSYQNGYRYPAMWEAFAFLNNGGVIRTGGIPQNTEALNIYDNSFDATTVSSFVAAVRKEVNTGINKTTAIQNNLNILKPNTRDYIKPEYINAFEVGYRGFIFEKLYVDAEYYFNVNTNFIGNLDAIQVLNGTLPNDIDKISSATDRLKIASTIYDNNGRSGGKQIDLGRQDQVQQYKIHTNSIGNVYSHGGSIALKYYVHKAIFNVSYTYSDIFKQERKDALVLGFNTPKNAVKASFIYPEFLNKNLAVSISYRWNQSYLWESFFITSVVPQNHIFDAQLSYQLVKFKTLVKLGGTNIFNNRYTQVAAGPTIGANYYLSLQIDLGGN